MLTRTKVFGLLSALFVAFSTKIFRLSPFMYIEQVSLGIGTVIGIISLITKYKKIDVRFRNWLLIFLGLGVCSVFTNMVHHNVGISSAVIGSVAYLNTLALVPVYLWMSRQRVFEKALSYLEVIVWVWFTLLLFLYFTDFNLSFRSPFTGGQMNVNVQALNKNILNIFSLHYLSVFFRTRHLMNLLLACLLFSSNMFGDFQRYIFVCFLVTIGIGLLVQKSQLTRVWFFPVFLLSMLIGIYTLNSTGQGLLVAQKFSSVQELFGQEQKSSDHSVNARVWQSEIALDGFMRHPIVGNGVFRSSVKEKLFGDVYFYLTDIGVVGILYAFGLIGILVFVKQVQYYRSLKVDSGYGLWIKLSVVFVLLYSLLTGVSILMPGIFLTLVLIQELSTNYESHNRPS